MIGLNQLAKYFRQVQEKISGINSFALVFSQENFTELVKNYVKTDYPVLIVVIPGAKTVAPDEDNIRDASNCLIFLLEALELKNLQKNELFTRMGISQDLMEKVKRQMIDDKHDHAEAGHLMHDLEPGSLITEPEYNFVGTYGWSLTFTLNPPFTQP